MNPTDPIRPEEPPGVWRRRAAALGLATLAVLLAHAALVPSFALQHALDDTSMEWRSRGIILGDRPDPNLMFIHVGLGHVLAALSGALPAVSWYRVLMVSTQFLASLTLYGLILRRSRGVWGLGLSGAYLLGFDVQMYAHPQFTVTAGIAGAAALLLVLERAGRGSRLSAADWAAFLGLFALACLIRTQSAQLMLALFLPATAFLMAAALVGARRDGAGLGNSARAALGVGLPFAVAVALNLGLGVVQRQAYVRDPGFADSIAMMPLIGDFLDYGRVPYDERTRPILEGVGWSRNDYDLLMSWAIADPELFPASKLAAVVAAVRSLPPAPGTEPARGRLRRGARGAILTVRHLAGPNRTDAVQLLLAVAPLLLGIPRRQRPVAWLTVATGAALLGLLFVAWERCPARVHQPLLAAVSACGLLAAAAGPGLGLGPWRGSRAVRAVTLIALLGAGGVVLAEQRAQGAPARRRAPALRAARRAIDPGPDRLYVGWGTGLPIHKLSYRADLAPLRRMPLFLFTGLSRLPLDRARLAGFGIEPAGMFRALYTRPDVSVFCDAEQANLLVQYAREHHGETVAFTERRFVLSDDGPEPETFSLMQFRRIEPRAGPPG